MIADASLARLGEWIEAQRLADGTPGVSLAIVERSGEIHEQAFGFANLDAASRMTPAHLFETGSIGKSFTAIALLQLEEEGRIDLQSEVTAYLPWFAVQTEFEPIRLHHLLTHTAGITSGIDYAPDARIQVWELRDTWTTSPPGARFHYSNIGFKVLGVVLERVEGTHYRETIQTRVLDRLGLAQSFPTITHAIRPKMAVGYGPAFDDRPWWPGRPIAPATWFETDTADGCLAMTASDLARYLAALLKRGEGLISTMSFEKLTGKGFEFEPGNEPSWYGYGMSMSIVDDHQYIGHSGGMVGYHSRMIGDLDSGMGVVALINGPGDPSKIARTALDLLRAEAEGKPYSFPANPEEINVTPTDFAGTFRSLDGKRSLTFTSAGTTLTLETDAGPISLRPFGLDSFVTNAAGHDRFMYAFERHDGKPTAVSYGGAWFVNGNHPDQTAAELPVDWLPFPGRYRAHNPWLTSFDVVARNGTLWLITPTQSDGFNGIEPLFPARDGWFRLTEDERDPEFIRFGSIVDGTALKATLSTGTYYQAAQ